ncbi:MAG TPA: collagen-like protein, partial [Ferruginibacter sp.]|nr:collagen-like protein [Ferruginibacter sp.]
GYTGSRGFSGSRGIIGYTGSKGAQGFSGSRGSIGFSGSKGAIGYTGSRGTVGFVGSKGSLGYIGSKGTSGTPLAGINAQSGTSYTVTLSDQSYMIECANSSPIAVTVPTNTTTAFPIGTVIHIAQGGTGQITISPADDTVTIKKSATMTNKTFGQESVVSLAKIDTNVWRLFGHLELA